jgi:hypothetical protein
VATIRYFSRTRGQRAAGSTASSSVSGIAAPLVV